MNFIEHFSCPIFSLSEQCQIAHSVFRIENESAPPWYQIACKVPVSTVLQTNLVTYRCLFCCCYSSFVFLTAAKIISSHGKRSQISIRCMHRKTARQTFSLFPACLSNFNFIFYPETFFPLETLESLSDSIN